MEQLCGITMHLFSSLNKTQQGEATYRNSKRIWDLVILVNHRKLGNWRYTKRLLKSRACKFTISFVNQISSIFPEPPPVWPTHDIKHLGEQRNIQSNHVMFLKPLKDLYYLEIWDIIQKYVFRCFLLATSLCCGPGQPRWKGQGRWCWWQQNVLDGMESVSCRATASVTLGMCKMGTAQDGGQRKQLSKFQSVIYI